MSLATKHCIPCEGGTPPLTREAAEVLRAQLQPGWEFSPDGLALTREYVLKNFVAVVALVNAIAEVAEHEGHHPELHLHSYKRLRVTLWTHAIGGLSENDFILAAKIDALVPAETRAAS